ncbi:MAG: hypothetical protein QXX77_03340 [Candidatus Methanosuratincola sp.]
MKRNLKCPNCGNVMASVGKQVLRIGPINAVLSVLVYPDMGAPIAFDAYVCEGCGKFELFADRDATKMLKGEYIGDELEKCSACGRHYVKEYLKCPYCGAEPKKA